MSLTDEIAVYRENTTAGIIYSGSDQAGADWRTGVVGFGYRALRSMTSGIRNTALGGCVGTQYHGRGMFIGTTP